MTVASSTPIPSNPQVRILPSHHNSTLLVWRITSRSEIRHLLQLVVLWRIEHYGILFHWMWRTCGLGVLMYQESHDSHSLHFNHYSHWWLVAVCYRKLLVLNWEVFISFNLSDLVNTLFIVFIRLYLRVMGWMDWWFRFARTAIYRTWCECSLWW